MKASMYFNYTSRSLLRGGLRTLLAVFCVAVGVMAIVALQLVGSMLQNSLTSSTRDTNGGDIAVTAQTVQSERPVLLRAAQKRGRHHELHCCHERQWLFESGGISRYKRPFESSGIVIPVLQRQCGRPKQLPGCIAAHIRHAELWQRLEPAHQEPGDHHPAVEHHVSPQGG